MDVMLAAAAGATGGTHPDAVVGAAQSAKSPDEAATNAQAIAGYANYSAAAKQLKGESLGNQSQAWDQFSPRDQDGLKAVGYVPPGQGGGLLGDIERGASAIPGLVGRGIGDITNMLGAPLRAEQHVERTALALLTAPADFAQAWDETTNGRAYIQPGFKQSALAQYGQQTYGLAYKLATGQTQQQILAATPAAQQQQVGNALNSSAVQQATAFLNNGHLSVGRESGRPGDGGQARFPAHFHIRGYRRLDRLVWRPHRHRGQGGRGPAGRPVHGEHGGGRRKPI